MLLYVSMNLEYCGNLDMIVQKSVIPTHGT